MQATLKKYNLHFVRMAELEKEIQKLKKKISELEKKLDNVQNIVENIEKDIYLEDIDEDELGDTITCPYCNYEIPIYYDEEIKEITCPECNNTIELDWNGGLDEAHGCSGNCSSCGGCEIEDEEEQ